MPRPRKHALSDLTQPPNPVVDEAASKSKKRVNPAPADDKPASKRNKPTKTPTPATAAKKQATSTAKSTTTKRETRGTTKKKAAENESSGSNNSSLTPEEDLTVTAAAAATTKQTNGEAKTTTTKKTASGAAAKQTTESGGSSSSAKTAAVRETTAKTQSKKSKSGPTATEKTAASSSRAKKPSDAVTSTAAAPSIKRKPNGKTNTKWEWITYCAPSWACEEDLEEEEEDKKKVDQEDNEAKEISCGRPNCKCGKPLSQNPSWPWVISKSGFEQTIKWQTERLKRCQDAFDVYFYNDFCGYGMMECVDNILLALDKELSKKRINAPALWALVEGLGLLFGGEDNIGEWFMCDDSDGIRERIEMLGVGLLTAIFMLVEKNFLSKSAKGTALELKSAPMTLGLWLIFAQDWDSMGGDDGSTGWKRMLVKFAELMGIDEEMCGAERVGKAWGEAKDDIQQRMEEEDEEEDDEDEDEDGDGGNDRSKSKGGSKEKCKTKGRDKEMSEEEKAAEDIEAGVFDRDESGERLWKKWHWAVEFDEFKDRHATGHPLFGGMKFGGRHYDLTKMSKKELDAARLGAGGPGWSSDGEE